MISALALASGAVAAIILSIPHSGPSQTRPAIDMTCYETDTPNELRCYRKQRADDKRDPSGWTCAYSFTERGAKGARQRIYCKNARTGDHKLTYGDFIK